MEMLLISLLFSLLFFSLSPMSFSIIVVFVSIILSVNVFYSSLSLIFSVLMIFIFSSGMMVVFCYCAIMVSYEEIEKNNSMIFSILLFTLFMMNVVFSSSFVVGGGFSMEDLNTMVPNFIIFIMLVIFILLKGVNNLLYNPFKGLMESY